ncbi:uncharacterized protein LOC110770852 isoform X2 [Prunus avium]|uniref:Uncharacterized protein LOC110770852 isoform X2 n=1 Tax=Prunus avium TaxID=42229 RepID=A0A6P5TSN8_PRUAV|nr:uncharacterized protein LOC110770852 isoform X2 [Prunus avium]
MSIFSNQFSSMEKSSRKTDLPDKAMTKSDLAAAQQLMQLSDEDNKNNSSSSSSSRINKNTKHEGEEVDQRPLINVITWAKIEEIFGKEEDVDQPKKRRYRSLASIYLTSKPVNAGSAHGKKVNDSNYKLQMICPHTSSNQVTLFVTSNITENSNQQLHHVIIHRVEVLLEKSPLLVSATRSPLGKTMMTWMRKEMGWFGGGRDWFGLFLVQSLNQGVFAIVDIKVNIEPT